MKRYTEDALVEQPAIELVQTLGWETLNCWGETFGDNGTLGRETSGDVVLAPRLRAALERLNPDLPKEAIDAAIEELTRDRGTMSAVQANHEIYDLLKEGVRVAVGSDEDGEAVDKVRVIDWNEPGNNDFFLASQFRVTGEMYKRRCDLVGFVNGLPLVFIELKASHKNVEHAYRDNLRDYKDTIPHIFWYNALIILSNGSESKLGSLTASWEHFHDWKKINSEGEEGIISLETMLRGVCQPARLLDIVENFTLFQNPSGGQIKLVARNHQYLGVNNAIEAIHQTGHNRGKLGVFWHTQGSGKSVSMIFFAQKILRTVPGNWTFVIVTDRLELDDQIYDNFATSGAITKEEVRAESSEHLRGLLSENHRYVFTLIQKFRTERGQQHPMVSDRTDIIVITDEAHRSQYDTFARNMRDALPNAAFIGFTGTPLMAGEELTRQVFGDYVSVYNFKQSIDDGATVPLYYENRIPELQLTNDQLNADMERLLEDAELDEDQERKVQREFGREYHLITREQRLETVAKDIVSHFTGREERGKAMVVCIDKATAIRMWDKVRNHWKAYREDLQEEVRFAQPEDREKLAQLIRYMDETDMAVIISPGQNEVFEMRQRGLGIKWHRERMNTEKLDGKFKDENDPLRIVFVCAMWMTGFDVPSCSTIYLDKPMRNHTLMQTIARANRVFKEKHNGLIVDYVGVFRNLQQALAIYGSGSGGGIAEGDSPVQDKSALVDDLQLAIAEATTFLEERGVNAQRLLEAKQWEYINLRDDAVNELLINDDTRRRYLSLADTVARIYRAILPDEAATEFGPIRHVIVNIADKLRSQVTPADISTIMGDVENVLNRSIAAEGYVIEDSATYGGDHLVDLSKIDFDALRAQFEGGRERLQADKLRQIIDDNLHAMIRQNPTRIDYLERFQQMIDEYNAGSLNQTEFLTRLTEFAQSLGQEQQRHIKEHLSEEELALFDLLTRPDIQLSEKEEQQVKNVAHNLLDKLNKELLVLDWKKRQQTRAAVRLEIDEMLDQLPDIYTKSIYELKCEATYQHIYEKYWGAGSSAYNSAA